MNPWDGVDLPDYLDFPRASGDEPLDDDMFMALMEFSPREWG